jgi:hypothetical protein
MSPTRVKSPFKPESGNFAFCRKSTPAEISTEPAGVMSTSSVRSGRCCAKAKRLVPKIKIGKIKRRINITDNFDIKPENL